VDELPHRKIDLGINTCSFMEMTSDQVRGYLDQLSAMEYPLIYSLNRDRTRWNYELTRVSELLR
jgi:hypothetical protein